MAKENKKKKTTAIAKVKAPVYDQTSNDLITQAIDKNVPVETMEKLLAMRKELKAEWAKEQFCIAMANFQGTIPTIKKEKIVKDKYGKERYRYAPIEVIVSQVKEALTQCGLAYAIETKCEEKQVTAICKVTHISGHSEESAMAVPIDASAYMNPAQKVAAANTFAKRYAFCNALGIMTGDQDDDSQATVDPPEKKAAPKPAPAPTPTPTPTPPIATEKQTEQIKELFDILEIETNKRLNWIKKTCKVKNYSEFTKEHANAVIKLLESRIKTKIEEKKEDLDKDQQKSVENDQKEIEKDDFKTRAMNCKTQTEAKDIIGMATLNKDISVIQIKALKGILTAKKFIV